MTVPPPCALAWLIAVWIPSGVNGYRVPSIKKFPFKDEKVLCPVKALLEAVVGTLTFGATTDCAAELIGIMTEQAEDDQIQRTLKRLNLQHVLSHLARPRLWLPVRESTSLLTPGS